MSKNSTLSGGIDTSKDKLDAAVHGQSMRLSVENVEAGWQQLVEAFHERGVTRVGIEATGGYERGVVRFLRAAGLTVVVMQPMQVKAFAKLHLRRAKNDQIDAELIAACTQFLGDNNAIEPDMRLAGLADQLTFVEQCEEDIVRIKTRREHVHDGRIRTVLEADLERLQTRRADELKLIAKALRQHSDLEQRLNLVLSIPGIGERTAIALIVRLPELGQVNREQAAALAGLAPFDNDSGRHRGERHIAGGRDRLRRSLYAAALPAAFHWNPELKELYQRLLKRGKCHKIALVACARKLVIYANIVVQRAKPWTKEKTA